MSKLERQTAKHDDVLTVIIRCFDTSELRGYRNAPYGMEPIETIRRPGESEAELLARAKSSARTVGGIFTFHELRQ